MARVYAIRSKWIKKEIDLAEDGFSNPKPMIAIRLRGNKQISTGTSQTREHSNYRVPLISIGEFDCLSALSV